MVAYLVHIEIQNHSQSVSNWANETMTVLFVDFPSPTITGDEESISMAVIGGQTLSVNGCV